jgi:hypothetical protein
MVRLNGERWESFEPTMADYFGQTLETSQDGCRPGDSSSGNSPIRFDPPWGAPNASEIANTSGPRA